MTDPKKLDTDELPSDPEDAPDDETNVAGENGTDTEEKQKLKLDVTIDNRSTCERHITVAIAPDDIERYFDKEFTELMPTAQVPGFRPGHVPRKLIEKRFRKDVADRVKSNLLMDSLAQVSEEEDLSPISEPDIDLEAIEIPAEGPMTFEFDLEVRPQFDLPKWEGLKIEKPVREFSEKDVDDSLQNLLANRGRLVPHDGAAEVGDYITTNLSFRDGETVLSHAEEEVIRIRRVLSFRDGKIEKFDELMKGVQTGDTRKAEAKLSEDAPNVAMRGKKIAAEFEILEVKKLELPELNEEFLDELGGFELEADLRDAIRDQLTRQLEYNQHQRAREQITAALTVAADWELPPEMLERQSHRELERAMMELQRSGFSDDEIRSHENMLRRNSNASTARALKEHFILERIAEDQEVDVTEEDYDREVELIAAQSNKSPRRVRARLEKSGSMDVLRNQIIERKVIDLILEKAKFKEVPYEMEETDEEAIEQTAGGHASDIPEAEVDSGEAAARNRPEEPPMRD